MGLFKRKYQTTSSKPLRAYLDLEEDSEDLDSGIHDTSWLVELGSEPAESDINTT
jgi:hypothetical protein